MKKFFVIYGVLLCSAFAYTHYIGWSLTGRGASSAWAPRGHGYYHK